MTNDEILNFAIENGMIDFDTINKQIEMNERKKYLEAHPYKIWEGKDKLWHTYLSDEENGRVPRKRKTKKELEDVIIEYYRKKENSPYLEQIFYEWASKKLEYGEIRKQTYDRYENDFKRFFKNNFIAEIKVENITEDTLEDFIKKSIHEKELTAKGWSNLRTILIGMFKYAKKRKYTNIVIKTFLDELEISPKTFKKVEIKSKEQVFTDYEVRKIFDFIRNNEMSIINLGIVLSFQTGLRAGELSALQYKDIDDNYIRIHNMEERYKVNGHNVVRVRETPKTDAGIRNIILTDASRQTLRLIRKINPFGKYIFQDENKRRIRGKAFTVKLYKICRYIGIAERSQHKARKTYGTKLLGAGVDENLIVEQMGHIDISTTRRYYGFNNKTREQSEVQLSNALNY